MDISQLNFEYLRLRNGPESVQHHPDDIKKGTGANASRKIFNNVPIDNFEKQHIRDLETELIERGISLPQRWSEGNTLRYLYASQFDHEKAIEKILGCIEWRNNPLSRTLTREVLFLFESGAVYLYGRDKQYRPILLLDFGKVDVDKVKGDDFNAAITILLDISINYCHFPGKVENCLIILDTRNLSVTKLPIGPLKNWIAIGNSCFPNIALKTYVVGPPFMVRMSWKLIEGLLGKETAAKIEILSLDELEKMNTLIDPVQLEKKFGGSLPDLVSYWPPKTTYHPSTPALSRKSLQEIDEVSNEGDPSMKLRTLASPMNAGFFQSVPASYNKLLDDAALSTPSGTHRANLSPGHAGRRSQIFEQPNRASFRVSHSPMRVKEGEEQLVNDILYSRITPTAPNFQVIQVHPPSSVNTSHHYSETSPSFRNNMSFEKVKKSANLPNSNDFYQSAPQSKQHLSLPQSGQYDDETTFYPMADNTLSPSNDLLDMILKEDRYLKQAQPMNFRANSKKFEPLQMIPDEYNDYEDKIAGRRTTEAKLKQHVDRSHSPQNQKFPFTQETQKKSRPMQPINQWQQEVPSGFESSYISNNYSLSVGGRDASRSFQNNSNPNNRYTEDWSSRKRRELPMQEEHREESDDEEAGFCGLCVSNRKKEHYRKRK